MPLAVGETFERYQIESLIGRGGMGEVYRASDTRLRRKVALKVLRADRESPEAVARLFREARAAAALTHPNTVAIHDMGEAEGHFYIVMEPVSGLPLLAYVGDARIPPARKLAWLADVARALGAAHKAGVIHRDVKPSNVMVSDEDVVKVLDFGLAKPLAPVSFKTQSGHVLGTPRYMSPEAFDGLDVDGRSDQYAFGLTAYELLSGHHPGGVTAGPVVPLMLDKVVSDITRPVAQIVARTLALKPDDRFATMEDVAVALEDAMAGRPLRDALVIARDASENLTATAPTGLAAPAPGTVRFGSAGSTNQLAPAPNTTAAAGGTGAAVVAHLNAALAPAPRESESNLPTQSTPDLPPQSMHDVIVSPQPLRGPNETILDPKAIARATDQGRVATLLSADAPKLPSFAKTMPTPGAAAEAQQQAKAHADARAAAEARKPRAKPRSGDLDVDTIGNAKANAAAMAQLRDAVANADTGEKQGAARAAIAKADAHAKAKAKAEAARLAQARPMEPAAGVPQKTKFPILAVVIAVLGLCAFAAAYYGSKYFSASPSGAGSNRPNVTPEPKTSSAGSAAPTPAPSTNLMPLTEPDPLPSSTPEAHAHPSAKAAAGHKPATTKPTTTAAPPAPSPALDIKLR